jgi:hypothetical protein
MSISPYKGEGAKKRVLRTRNTQKTPVLKAKNAPSELEASFAFRF